MQVRTKRNARLRTRAHHATTVTDLGSSSAHASSGEHGARLVQGGRHTAGASSSAPGPACRLAPRPPQAPPALRPALSPSRQPRLAPARPRCPLLLLTPPPEGGLVLLRLRHLTRAPAPPPQPLGAFSCRTRRRRRSPSLRRSPLGVCSGGQTKSRHIHRIKRHTSHIQKRLLLRRGGEGETSSGRRTHSFTPSVAASPRVYCA